MTEYRRAVGMDALLYRFAVVAMALGVYFGRQANLAYGAGWFMLGLAPTVFYLSAQADGAFDRRGLDDLLGVLQYGAFGACLALFVLPFVPSKYHPFWPIRYDLGLAMLATGLAIGPIRYFVSGRPFRWP